MKLILCAIEFNKNLLLNVNGIKITRSKRSQQGNSNSIPRDSKKYVTAIR